MKIFFQILLAFFLTFIAVFSVSYLQHRFDASDIKHAIAAVQMTKPQAGQDQTIVQKIEKNYAVSAANIQWSADIESKVQGTVLVSAVVSGKDVLLRWEVDLVRFSVKPVSEAAVALGK